MQEAVVCYRKISANNTGTMGRWGKHTAELSRPVMEMPLEINCRLKSKTSSMSHISQNNQTPPAPSGKSICPWLCASPEYSGMKTFKNKMGRNKAEGEEAG